MKKKLLIFFGLLVTIGLFAENPTPYKSDNGLWGYKDTQGYVVIEAKFDEAFDFFEGRAGVRVGEDYGFIDGTGAYIIKPQFAAIGHFSQGIAFATKGWWKSGDVINIDFNNSYLFGIDGKKLASFKYDGISYIYNHTHLPETSSLYYGSNFDFDKGYSTGLQYLTSIVKNKKGGKLLIPGNQFCSPTNSAGYRTCITDVGVKFHYIVDTLGVERTNFNINATYSMLNSGCILYKYENPYITASFERIPDTLYSQDLSQKVVNPKIVAENSVGCVFSIPTADKEKYGFAFTNGTFVPPIYERCLIDSLGYAYVVKDGKSGIVNCFNELIVPMKYRNSSFESGCWKNPLIDLTNPLTDEKNALIAIWSRDENSIHVYDVYSKDGQLIIPDLKTNCPQCGIDDYLITYNVSYQTKHYVSTQLAEWQQKGEFESTKTYQARVNEHTRQQKIRELAAEAQQYLIETYAKNMPLKLSLGKYDADNEVFMVTDYLYGNLLVPVPISAAENFRDKWNQKSVIPKYYINADSKIDLASVEFIIDGRSYTYNCEKSVEYNLAQVEYNFSDLELDDITIPQANNIQKGQQNIGNTTVSVGMADVDINIPHNIALNTKTFAVIINNENYTQLKSVPFAIHDGEIFAQYCENTLGLPKENISRYSDATYGTMLQAIRKIKQIAKAYNGDINIIFYYSGHGAPTDDTKEAYLLPVDAFGVAPEVCYSLNNLYKELGELNTKSVTMFLDACFSGATKDGDMLASVRGVAIKAKSNVPVGNMVVFSAATDEQTALPYTEKGHGLFTYFLLKKLQDTNGDVTFDELSQYLKQEVYRRSSVMGQAQEPTVTASSSLTDWGNKKMK